MFSYRLKALIILGFALVLPVTTLATTQPVSELQKSMRYEYERSPMNDIQRERTPLPDLKQFIDKCEAFHQSEISKLCVKETDEKLVSLGKKALDV